MWEFEVPQGGLPLTKHCHENLHASVGFLFLDMYFFYIDESGSPEGHHEPLLNGETPIFTLNSMCIKEDYWRSLDRDYLALKRQFFSKEIGNRQAEYYEIKGHKLIQPHNKTSRRRREFIKRVSIMCQKYEAVLFSISFLKNAKSPTSKKSLYTMALQYLVERFQSFLEEKSEPENGIMIVDSRIQYLDIDVAKSHLSYIFGHNTGKTCDRIIEAPLFTNSTLTTGLQVTDIIGSCIYADYYLRNCMFIPGHLDYSHMQYVWSFLQVMEFKSIKQYGGRIRHGFRLIDFSSQ